MGDAIRRRNDAVRAADWAPRSVRMLARKLENVEQKLATRLGRVPTLDEMAEAFRIRARERRYLQAFRERHYDFLRRFVEIKTKIEIEAIEYDNERPQGRFNDGRRVWNEAEDGAGAARASHGEGAGAPRAAHGDRAGRSRGGFRPTPVSRDPFFDKPYEAPAESQAPGWEATARPARSGSSPNIKQRRKVAALFKSPPAPEPVSES